MNAIFNIKRLSAVVLMFAFFMPLSQCSALRKESSNSAPEVIIKYAYTQDKNSPLELYVNIAVFFWPILMVVLFSYKKPLRSFLLIKFLELLFCIGTGYMLVTLNIFGKPLYGSYVACFAISLYGLLTLGESCEIIVSRKRIRLLSQAGEKNPSSG